MGKQGRSQWQVRPVSDEEVRRFMIAHGASDNCFSCGTDAWHLDGGDEGLFRTQPWARAYEDDSYAVRLSERAFGLPVVSMTCMNCGFIRSHSLGFIISWLDRESQKDNEGGKE